MGVNTPNGKIVPSIIIQTFSVLYRVIEGSRVKIPGRGYGMPREKEKENNASWGVVVEETYVAQKLVENLEELRHFLASTLNTTKRSFLKTRTKKAGL